MIIYIYTDLMKFSENIYLMNNTWNKLLILLPKMKARLMTTTYGKNQYHQIQIPSKGECGKIKFTLNFLPPLFAVARLF